MFDLIYLKLKKFHDKLSHQYTCLLNEYPYILISFYLLLNILFIILLFIIKINISLNTQNLLVTKNSEYPALKQEISVLFEQNQSKRHFAQQLLDGGYYIDVILKSKSSVDTNLINSTYLDEYDFLFNEIMNLSIIQNNKTYSYKDDLCARRLQKCSIEGGILHAPSFRESLLKHEVNYNENDARALYMDTVIMDGTSLNFLFGNKNERDEKLDTTGEPNIYFGYPSYIVGVKYIRNRFDLLYNSPVMAELSLKWLDRFVEYMNENSTRIAYKHIDISFATSHHLEKEIEFHSQFDVKYVMVSVGMLVFFFFICIYITNISRKFGQMFDFYLPFLSLIQILFTITSTISLLNLINVLLTPLIATNILILLIINFTQTINLFKAVSATTTTTTSKQTKEGNCKINVIKRLTVTFQNLLVPQMYSTLTIILVYTSISFITAFEAVRIYCVCTSKFIFTNPNPNQLLLKSASRFEIFKI
jgi:hypothetical protein